MWQFSNALLVNLPRFRAPRRSHAPRRTCPCLNVRAARTPSCFHLENMSCAFLDNPPCSAAESPSCFPWSACLESLWGASPNTTARPRISWSTMVSSRSPRRCSSERGAPTLRLRRHRYAGRRDSFRKTGRVTSAKRNTPSPFVARAHRLM